MKKVLKYLLLVALLVSLISQATASSTYTAYDEYSRYCEITGDFGEEVAGSTAEVIYRGPIAVNSRGYFNARDHSWKGPDGGDAGVTWSTALNAWEVAAGNHVVYADLPDNSATYRYGGSSWPVGQWSSRPFGNNYISVSAYGIGSGASHVSYNFTYETPFWTTGQVDQYSEPKIDDDILASTGEITSLSWQKEKAGFRCKNSYTCEVGYTQNIPSGWQDPYNRWPAEKIDWQYYGYVEPFSCYVVTVTGSGGSSELWNLIQLLASTGS